MTLIVETGAVVTDSNSYVSRADYIAYAALIGTTIADEAATDEQLIEAARFIDSHESRMKGYRSERDQSMAFPRVGVVIEGWEWNSDEIPRNVELAQMNIALDLNAGIDVYNPPQSDSVGIKRERIEGAIEVEYAVGDAQKLSRRSMADALIRSFLNNAGLSLAVTMA